MDVFFKGLWTTCKVIGVAAKVTGGVAAAAVRGAVNTLDTTAQALDKVNCKDWDGLERLAEHKINQLGYAVENKLKATCELGNEVEECLKDKNRPFLTKENTRRMTTVATVGVGMMSAGAAGASILDIDADDAGVDDNDPDDAGLNDVNVVADDDSSIVSTTYQWNDASDEGATDFVNEEREDWPDYPDESGYGYDPSVLTIQDGAFIGSSDELVELTRMGQIDGTTHIDEEDLIRDMGARNEFLRMHGYDGVPEGWEVHHVVPLSEGGADSPDNMILIMEDDHDYITSAHSRFYGWHRN